MTPSNRTHPGALLDNLTWLEAETLLTENTVVVIPLGAGAKEHGPHLLLKNDLLLADYLAKRVLEHSNVVIAPTINYHYYPAFVEYPGSVSLRLETARDLIVDIVKSLARFGPRRFYVLNTGISTVRALEPAAQMLADEGLVLKYTRLGDVLEPLAKLVQQQEGGSHADEIETSMMLYLAPDTVKMSQAVKDYDPNRKGRLSRTPGPDNTYSPSGIWGDATLATKEKGKTLVEGLVQALLQDIEALRNIG